MCDVDIVVGKEVYIEREKGILSFAGIEIK